MPLLLLLLLLFCLSMFACACWCALSSKRSGARSGGRDASRRRQHFCDSIEDEAYCGVKLHLAACRSWVGLWDDGRLGALLLLSCCVLFVVDVVVAAVVLFLLVSIYVSLRVLVCSVTGGARRSVTRAGCRSPAPTLLCYCRRPGVLRIQPTPSSLL